MNNKACHLDTQTQRFAMHAGWLEPKRLAIEPHNYTPGHMGMCCFFSQMYSLFIYTFIIINLSQSHSVLGQFEELYFRESFFYVSFIILSSLVSLKQTPCLGRRDELCFQTVTHMSNKHIFKLFSLSCKTSPCELPKVHQIEHCMLSLIHPMFPPSFLTDRLLHSLLKEREKEMHCSLFRRC